MADATILSEPGSFLDGRMLVAMPGMSDPRFARAVVYVCAHSDSGAMGIVVNKPAPNLDFGKLLVQLEVIEEGEAIRLPAKVGGIGVMKGGPVETGRGFVLHTPDVRIENSTLPIDETVCLTATVDILRAIARDEGPARAVLALGYAGWGAGQLEGELLGNGWLHCDADLSLIFDPSPKGKYERALRKIGVDPGMLSATSGRA